MLRRLFNGSTRRSRSRGRRRSHSKRHRRSFLESLETRLLLTGDTPGDDLASAQALSLTPGVTSEFHENIGDGTYGFGDVDLFKVSLSAGQSIDVDVDAEYLDDGSAYSFLDSHLRLFDSSGMELASNGDGASANDDPFTTYDSYLSFTATVSGDYYVGVSSVGNESYDPAFAGSGMGYYDGDYVLQLHISGGGGGGGGNQVPAANDDSYSVDQDGTLTVSAAGILANDFDGDGDPLTASLQSNPVNGAINYLNGDGAFEYVPDASFVGSDSFTYYVNDGTDNSAPATVTITVNGVSSDPGDDLPSAPALSLTPNAATELQHNIGDGLYGYADVDLFKVNLAAGQTLDIDLDAEYLDNGSWYSSLDGHLRLFDNSGLELANNGNSASANDAPFAMYDSYLSFTATVSGDYYVGVSSAGNETYDPSLPGMGTGYTSGDYVLQLLITGGSNQAPIIAGGQTFGIAEDAAAGASLGTLAASDAESDPLQNWSITTGNADGVFAIGASSGLLTIDGPANLNFEANSSYVLTLTVSDGTSTSAAQTVTIDIFDVDEFDVGAISDSDSMNNSVAENSVVGSNVGVTASATDGDGTDTITFSLDDDAGGRFTINPTTGVVTTGVILDAESAASHTITVRATSTDGSFATSDFIVSVLDSNDDISPAADIDASPNSVSESAPIGSSVGVTILADDPDAGSSVGYSLDNDAGGRFAIDATTGVVTTAALLDAETAVSHTVAARATSSDGSFATIGLSISVADVDEFDVGAVNDSQPALNEVASGAAAGALTGLVALAIDMDVDDVVTYSLDDDAGGRFSIDANSGVVTTTQPLDVTTPTHTLVVRATSTDGSAATGSFSVGVVQNTRPVITAGQAFSIWETAIVDSFVGTITATANGNNLQDWEIIGGNEDGVFSLHPVSGHLSVADTANLNADITASYQLTVTVSGGSKVSDSEVVNVDVISVNDPIVVDFAGDGVDPNDAVTTLREAIEQADSAPGIDVIEFDLPADSVIELSYPTWQPERLTIDSQVQILGPSDGSTLTITIDDVLTPDIGILAVTSTADARVSDLLISGGNPASGDGGGIWNAGQLTLERVTLANNVAGAGDGGGIFNASTGDLTVRNSTVSSNTSSGSGGGIYNAGTLSVFHSTIAGNTATLNGGGVFTETETTSVLQNTIIATNYGDQDAAGDFISLGHNLVGNADNATGLGAAGDQLGNAGSVLNPLIGPLLLYGGAAPTHALLSGSPAIDAGDNLLGLTFDQRGAPRVLDGPDLLDASDATATTDIGAFEFGTFFVNSEADATDTSTLGDGRVDTDPSEPGDQVSIRAAIQELNRLAGWDGSVSPSIQVMESFVLFNPHLDTLWLTKEGDNEDQTATGDLDVFGNLTVRDKNHNGYEWETSIDGGWGPTTPTGMDLKDRIFHVLPGSRLNLDSVSVRGGHLYDDGTEQSRMGGAVFNDAGTLELVNAYFGEEPLGRGGSEAWRGGGIYTRDGTVSISGSILNGHRAILGGAIYIESGTVTVDDQSQIRGGHAVDAGGGIFLAAGELLITGQSQVLQNFVITGELNEFGTPSPEGTPAGINGLGGGIAVFGGSATISGQSVITENMANMCCNLTQWGGGVYNESELLIEDGSRIEANGYDINGYMGSPIYGAGIYNRASLTVRDAFIDENASSEEGSGLYNSTTGTAVIERSSISRNFGDNLGTAIYNENGDVTLIESRVEENQTSMEVPGILNYDLDAQLTLIDSTFARNKSELNGSVVSNQHGSLTVEGSTFANNTKDSGGGPGVGEAILHNAQHVFLGDTPQGFLSLYAAVNPEQTILFVEDVSPIEDFALPVGIIVGDERMTVTAVDPFLDALEVTRTDGAYHSVADPITIYINETQPRLTLADAGQLQRYELPFDIIVGYEVMTVTALEDNVATVERGRNGSVAVSHRNPAEVWGVAGSMTVSNSTFSSNDLRIVSNWDAGGAIYNRIHPFVRPTVIENSTFDNNGASAGASIFTEMIGLPKSGNYLSIDEDPPAVIDPEAGDEPDESSPFAEGGYLGAGFWHPEWEADWSDEVKSTIPTKSLFVQNNVFNGGKEFNGQPTFDVAGRIELYDVPTEGKDYDLFPPVSLVSGGNNLISADFYYYTSASVALPASATTFHFFEPAAGLPELPFPIRVSHTFDRELFHEEMLVTDIVRDSHGMLESVTVLRGQNRTPILDQPVGAQVTISASGFTTPGDRHGTLHEVSNTFETGINSVLGIDASQTQFAVTDSTNFPHVPFELRATHFQGLIPVVEYMLVTDVQGNTVTVLRGQNETTPLAHPASAVVTFNVPLSSRLDARLGPLEHGGGAAQVHAPLADSPVLETGSKLGFTGGVAPAASNLIADYSFATEFYMALDPAAQFAELAVIATAYDTTLLVDDTSGLPPAPFLIRVGEELMNVLSVDMTLDALTVERGAYGTAITQHAAAETVLHGEPITATATQTTLNVSDVTALPAAPFVLRGGAELMRVTAVDEVTNTITVDRGAFGSLLESHATTSTTSSSYLDREFLSLLGVNPTDVYTELVNLVTGGTQSTLDFAADASDTTIAVANASAFPPAPFAAQFQHDGQLLPEVIWVTAVDATTNTLATVRGAFATQAGSYSANDHEVVVVDSMALVEADYLPLSPFIMRIGDELIDVGAVDVDVDGVLIVERGFEGTATVSHAPGVTVLHGKKLPELPRVGATTLLKVAGGVGQSQLDVAVAADVEATVIMVDNASAFPAAPFAARFQTNGNLLPEVVWVIGIDTVANTLEVLRARFGTEVAAYSANDHELVVVDSVALEDTGFAEVADSLLEDNVEVTILVEEEVMQVTAVDADLNHLLVQRGFRGTAAVPHSQGAPVLYSHYLIPADSALAMINISNAQGLPDASFLSRINGDVVRVLSINLEHNHFLVKGLDTELETNDTGALVDPSTLFEFPDASVLPAVPFGVLLGSEVMRVTAVNVEHNLATLERAAFRDDLSEHSVNKPVIFGEVDGTHGYHRLEMVLTGMSDDPAVTQVTVVTEFDLPTPVPFDIRIDREEMEVYSVVENPDGSLTFHVTRGVNGTTVAPAHVVGSTVLLLVDQSRSERFIDSNGDAAPHVDVGAAEALVFTVNTTSDIPDLTPGNGIVDTGVAGEISLRAAIMEINATVGAGTIILPHGTYPVTSALKVIGNMKIVGQGANLPLIQGSSDRLFHVQPGATLELTKLALTDGVAPEGIANEDGGAILVEQGTLLVQDSYIHGNTGANGGAIASAGGVVTVVNSTLSDNVAGGSGGAIFALGGSLDLRNSTLSGNIAAQNGGALLVGAATSASLGSNTVTDNSATLAGGIYNSGSAQIVNSIVAGNLAESEPDLFGHFQSLGGNLIGARQADAGTLSQTVTASQTSLSIIGFTDVPEVPFTLLIDGEYMLVTAIGGGGLTVVRGQNGSSPLPHTAGAAVRADQFWQTGDQTGTAVTPLDAQLKPLQFNHSNTPTHSLPLTSPGINAGLDESFAGLEVGFDSQIDPHTITVSNGAALPPAPFDIRFESTTVSVVAVDDFRLEMAGPANWLPDRGGTGYVLTDQRGAPRFVGQNYDRLDVGAFQLAAALSLTSVQPHLVEGDSGTTSFTFTVTRSGLTTQALSVDYVVTPDGNHPAGPADFSGNALPLGTVSFAAGETTKTIVIDVAGDEVVEADEGFLVTLRNATAGGWIVNAAAAATILNDDTASLSITNPTVTEGRALLFEVSLDEYVQGGFKLPWNAWDDTVMIVTNDYIASSGELLFIGYKDESYKVVVPTVTDEIVELDETLKLLLGPLVTHQVSPTAITVPAHGLGTVTNNDTTTLTVSNVRRLEGDNGTTNFDFDVTLYPNPVDVAFDVDLTPADQTATGGSDFTVVSSALQFTGTAGQVVSGTVSVSGDLTSEDDETFALELASLVASGREASITLSNATATILNDDNARVVVRDVRQIEADSGTSVFTFDVVAIKPLGPLTVDVSTVDATATAGDGTNVNDYVAKTETLSFSGVDGETQSFSVEVQGDEIVELDEIFHVALSNLQAGGSEMAYTLVDGIGTVVNRDVATLTIEPVVPCVLPHDPRVVACQSEGDGNVTFRVKLTGAVDVPLTVGAEAYAELATSDDFTASTQTLSFSGADDQTVEFDVTILDDDIIESARDTFAAGLVNLQASGRHIVLGPDVLALITDDDEPQPTVLDECGEVISGGDLDPPSPGMATPTPLTVFPRLGNMPGQPSPFDTAVYGQYVDRITGLDTTFYGANATHPGLGIQFQVLVNSLSDLTWSLQNAVTGDTGWGRDLYGYAIVLIGGYLVGSVDGLNYGLPWYLMGGGNGELRGCEEEEEHEEYVDDGEPEEVVKRMAIEADWVVSHQSDLKFNPFTEFNYRLAHDSVITRILQDTSNQGVQLNLDNHDVAATIIGPNGNLTRIGDSAQFAYGTVTVNQDSTLTYTPLPGLKEQTTDGLLEEFDRTGQRIRFTGLDEFDIHLVPAELIQATTAPVAGNPGIYLRSKRVQLATSNQQAVLRGDRYHSPDGTLPVTLSLIDKPVLDANGNPVLDSNQQPVTERAWQIDGLDADENPPDLRVLPPVYQDILSNTFALDGPIYADLESSYRLDLRDLLVDPDINEDPAQSDELEIYAIQSPTGWHSVDAEVKLGELISHSASTGVVIGTVDKFLNVRKLDDTTIEIENPLRSYDVLPSNPLLTWDNLGGASQMSFRVLFTDGQMLPAPPPENGDPPGPDMPVVHSLDFTVKPNTEGLNWATLTGVKHHLRPWVIELDEVDAGALNTDALRITPRTHGGNSEIIGGSVVNLQTGEFLRTHALTLDASGGGSELAIPGLVYDSSVVHVEGSEVTAPAVRAMPIVQAELSGVAMGTNATLSAELIWHNASGAVSSTWTPASVSSTGDYLITISPPEIDDYTGVYPWDLVVTITDGADSVEVRTSGETPVVVGDHANIFGDGWALQGVPSLSIDLRGEISNIKQLNTLDDRILLNFPGTTPKIFNAKWLTLNDYSYAGELGSLQAGSMAISGDGFGDPQEYGTLTARQGPDELVYDDGTGTEYVFKPHVNDQGTPTDTDDDTTLYLIDRIEQPGIDFNTVTGAWPAGRRGISFEWLPDWDSTRTDEHPQLLSLTASDGARTDFGYNAFGFVASQTMAGATNLIREVEFSINSAGELIEILHKSSPGLGYETEDRVRRFDDEFTDVGGTLHEYQGRLATDRWYDGDNKLERHTQFTYDTAVGALSAIQLGDGTASENNVLYEIASAVAGDGLEGRLTIAASDLKKYDESSGATPSAAGVHETTYVFSVDGNLVESIDSFSGFELSRDSWEYDQAGGVKRHTNAIGTETSYWHDYETLLFYAQDDSNSGTPDELPRYDPDDYRGNLTYVVAGGGMSFAEHETDDEMSAAVGTLVRRTELGNITPHGLIYDRNESPADLANIRLEHDKDRPQARRGNVSLYNRRLDGQLRSRWTLRGKKDDDDQALSTTELPVPDRADRATADYFESWTYLASGLVHTHTDARQLTTTYTYDSHNRVATVNDGTTETSYAYDANGYPSNVTTKYGANYAGNRATTYDSSGRLLEENIYDGNSSLPYLSRTSYEYAADGTRTATIVYYDYGANAVRTDSTFDKAGLLTEVVEAGEVDDGYYSIYTGSQESVKQTTRYGYYADGSLKEVTLPDGTKRQSFRDPSSRTLWQTTNRVSDGAHTLSGDQIVAFNLGGTQVTRSIYDALGNTKQSTNLQTGAESVATPAEFGKGLPGRSNTFGKGGKATESQEKLDVRGNVERYTADGLADIGVRYDEFSGAASVADLQTRAMISENKTTAAGDVYEATATRTTPQPAGGTLTETFTTTYEYDQHGRVIKIIDPLSSEAGVSPAEIEYSFDTNYGQRRVTSTSRTGDVTSEWFDSLGRTSLTQNAAGAFTYYQYDLAGNLTSERFEPVAGDTRPPRHTEYRYDTLGRLRATIELGSQPFFTAVDYFQPSMPGVGTSHGFDVVEFGPIAGSDPAAVSGVNDQATRTVLDSLGNPVYVLGPDIDPDPNDVEYPATLITYDYLGDNAANTLFGLTEPLFSLLTTTTQTVAATGSSQTADMDYDHKRVFHELTDVYGNSAVSLAHGFPLTRFDRYNAQGLLESSMDGALNTTRYTYDDHGNVETITRADTSTMDFVYNSSGQVVLATNERGHNSEYQYDALGRQVLKIEPSGETTHSFYYGKTTEIKSTPSPLNIVTVLFDDPTSGIRLTVDAAGGRTTKFLDSAGNVVRVEDPRSNNTHFEYDRFDRLTKTTNALGKTSDIAYDFSGNVVSETDELSRTTSHEYDNLNRRVKTIDPRGGVTTFTYDVSGNLLEEHFEYDGTGNGAETHDPIIRTTKHEYNGQNQLVKTIEAAGTLDLETEFTYDLAGNLKTVTDPLQHTTTYVYDKLNRRTEVTDQLQHKTVTAYLDNGGTVTVTRHREDGSTVVVSKSEYDEGGRLERHTDAEDGITRYDVDPFGNVKKITDSVLPDGNETHFEYDELHRVISEKNELGDSRYFYYDENSNIEFQVDRNERVTRFHYDELNRLTKEEWIAGNPAVPAGGPTAPWRNSLTVDRTLEYGYDDGSRMTSASDPSASYTYGYDLLDGLTSSTHDLAGLGVTVSQTGKYDAVGNRTGLDISLGGNVDVSNEYQYDEANRMTHVTQEDGGFGSVTWKHLTLTYDAASRVDTISRYLHDSSTLVAWSDFDYDGVNRLTELYHYIDVPSSELAGYRYEYDDLDRITKIDSLADGIADFTYDDTDQLKSATFPNQPNESYDYDKNGNRTGGTYTPAPNNQLQSDGTYSYEYDDEGNRIKRVTIATGEQVEYEWDYHNRLTGVKFLDGSGAATKHVWYDYDVFDRRVLKRVDDSGDGTPDREEHYVYDDSQTSDLDAIAMVFDGNDDVTHRYLHGPGVDQVFADENDLGDVLWALTDHQGTVRDIAEYDEVADTTDVVKHVTYGAFGNILSVTDGSGAGIGDDTLHHAYTGREWDADAELYYYRARWYDAEVGRFISEDPMGFDAGDTNLNRYVGNDVVNRADPSGLQEALPPVLRSLKAMKEAGLQPRNEGPNTSAMVVREDGSVGRVSNSVERRASQHRSKAAADVGTSNSVLIREGDRVSLPLAFTEQGARLDYLMRKRGEILDRIRELEAKQRRREMALAQIGNPDIVFDRLERLQAMQVPVSNNRFVLFYQHGGVLKSDYLKLIAELQYTMAEVAELPIDLLSSVPGGGVTRTSVYWVAGEEQSGMEVALNIVGDVIPIGLAKLKAVKPARALRLAPLPQSADELLKQTTFQISKMPANTMMFTIDVTAGAGKLRTIAGNMEPITVGTRGVTTSNIAIAGDLASDFDPYILFKPMHRGQYVERYLSVTEYADWYNVGSEMNGFFPLVDFQRSIGLSSLKTVDTHGSSWFGRTAKHLRELSSSIRGGLVDGKPARMILDLRVQRGGIDLERETLNRLLGIGRDVNVDVRIIEF